MKNLTGRRYFYEKQRYLCAAALIAGSMTAGVGAASDKPNADDTQLGDWARSSVYAMREIGIMPGKENNRFRPKDGYTQEQAVVTVERAVSGCEAILKLFFSVDFSVHILPQISSLWMFAAVLFL